jgi:hypothetical protein
MLSPSQRPPSQTVMPDPSDQPNRSPQTALGEIENDAMRAAALFSGRGGTATDISPAPRTLEQLDQDVRLLEMRMQYLKDMYFREMDNPRE